MLRPFRPHPLFRGGHAQTIAGCYLPGLTVVERATKHVVELPDGDRIVLHDDDPLDPGGATPASANTPASQNRRKVVLLVHGLGGSHRSGYLQRCMHKLTARGIRTFRMDLRGCGAGVPLARFPVHAGRSQDVGAALEFILRRHEDASVYLVGFSMGANLILKLLGELGDLAPRRLIGAMAVAPPIDLLECSRNLKHGLGWLYDRAFVTGLLKAAARRRQHVPDAHNLPPTVRPKRLFDFDEAYTAPVGGYASAEDYYVRASSGPFLKHITVPTLIVTAANDPIIPVRPFEAASYSPTTKLVITPCGGHLGYIGVPKVDPDRRWLDWRLIEWVESLTAADPAQEKEVEQKSDAAPAALARLGMA